MVEDQEHLGTLDHVPDVYIGGFLYKFQLLVGFSTIGGFLYKFPGTWWKIRTIWGPWTNFLHTTRHEF